jgi:hypothetical protein
VPANPLQQPLPNLCLTDATAPDLSLQITDGEAAGKNYNTATAEGQRLNYGGMSLGSDGERVAALTIDSLRLSKVSFMKFDVQGAESVAMYGAQATIARYLPVIAVEWDAPMISNFMQEHMRTRDVPAEVQAFDALVFLKSLGYTMYRKVSDMDYFCFPPNYQYGKLPRFWLPTKSKLASLKKRRKVWKRQLQM